MYLKFPNWPPAIHQLIQKKMDACPTSLSSGPLLFLIPCCCFVSKSCLTLCKPKDCSPPEFSVHGISRQEYWSGLPFPSLGDLANPGIEPLSPALAGGFFTTEPLGKCPIHCCHSNTVDTWLSQLA